MNEVTTYNITVMGKPVGKERPRFNKRSGRAFTPQKTQEYESKVAKETARVIHEPFSERGVTVIVHAYFANKVHSDLDNIMKSVMDGMNGIAYVDDRIVDEIHGYIAYVDDPSKARVEIEVIGSHQ